MAHIAVSAELSAFLADRIASYRAEAPEELQWASSFVAEFAALPLYFGWSETIALSPDGRMVRWSNEGEYVGAQPIQELEWVLPALVAGAARYPALQVLLPTRPPGAVDCPCRAHPLFASGQVLCGRCGGVGWLAAEGRA
jgi:hypothetical protein